MSAMAMSGMSAAGWSLASAGLFLAVWTIMMAAMMLPAAAPMIVVFATAQAGRGRPTAVPTWIFVAGYLLVWVVTGAAVYVVVQVGTEAATLLSADRPGQLGAAIARVHTGRSRALSVHSD